MHKAQSNNRVQTAASRVVLCSALTWSLGRKTADSYIYMRAECICAQVAEMLADWPFLIRAGFSERGFRGATLFNADECAWQSREYPPFNVNLPAFTPGRD
jgi:hypothetical protein